MKKTVAEVENLDYISMAERFDIGTVINKKLIAASKIYELLLKADASNIKSLTIADANVGEVTAKPNSKVTKKLIKNLNLPSDITFGALIRNGEPMLVDGDTLIEPYDQVVVFFPQQITQKHRKPLQLILTRGCNSGTNKIIDRQDPQESEQRNMRRFNYRFVLNSIGLLMIEAIFMLFSAFVGEYFNETAVTSIYYSTLITFLSGTLFTFLGRRETASGEASVNGRYTSL